MIEAHDLLWDMKLALVGSHGKTARAAGEKKRSGRPQKKNTS